VSSCNQKNHVYHLFFSESKLGFGFVFFGNVQIMIPQIETLTEEQLLRICNLEESSRQAEDAISQGMEVLQQSLADTVAASLLGSSPNVADYMGQMAMALRKLGTVESFVQQVGRQQSLCSSWFS
jgi:transcription factor TGA